MRVQFRQQLILTLLLSLLLCNINSFAQKNSLRGIVVDTAENKSLHYAIIALIDLADTTLYRAIRSDASGNFSMEKIAAGKYSLMISYPKMADFLQELLITDSSKIDLKKVPMTAQAVLLQEVIVSSGKPIRMRGDTLEYTADSFATSANANVEELLKRLPGIYVERNGKIYAQGKEVQKILVDGDEFFAEDPGLASQFLRADAIDKVQVFDQRSERAEFTGIDDGIRTKTINLKLKANKKKGVFGKLTARANTDDFYRYEAMGAYFDGPRKMSVFGLASRVGNYLSDFTELTRYVSSDYETIDDGTNGLITVSREDYEGPASGALPTALDGGAHYSDKWNEAKQKLFFNYRIRNSEATDWSRSNSYQVLPDGKSFTNNTDRNSSYKRFSQKASFSFSNEIDSFSSIKFSVGGKRANGEGVDNNSSSSINEKGFRVNDNLSQERSKGQNSDFDANITYKLKFRKEGRSLMASIQHGQGNFKKDNFTTSATNYFDPETGAFNRKDSLDQLQQSNSDWHSFAGKIYFTEKIAENLSLSAEYGWKRADASSAFGVFNNKANMPYQKVDSLSNDYDFISTTHISSVNAGWSGRKFNLSVGGRVFFTRFMQQENDRDFSIKRNFVNWSPNINGQLRIKESVSISLSYNGQTNQPGINQLQPIRRTTNNLYVQIGNPDLKPSFFHNVNMSFSNFSMNTMRSWFGALSMFYIQNGITNKTAVDAQGKTTSQYVNINGLPSFSGSVGLGLQNKKRTLRSDFGLNAGIGGDYRLQNNERVKNSSFNAGFRASLNYEWKDIMSTGYTGMLRYNATKANIEAKTNKFISHVHSLNNTFFLPWSMSVTSTANFTFQPKNSSFNSSFNYVTWNASLIKTVFKSKNLVFKFEVNDILNQTRGFSRSVNGANAFESERFVVRRFWLISATWNFSKNI